LSFVSEICEDPEAFDRAAWRRTMDDEVVAFFDRTLRSARGGHLDNDRRHPGC
jgi:predicted dienelactone hydrolase